MNDRERMLISAHSDGEVEDPWKAPLEHKIASDPLWAEEARLHARVKELLATAAEPDFRPSLDRVKARVEGVAPARAVVRLPVAWLSVAAAALLVLAAGGGYWWGRTSTAAVTPTAVAELQVTVPKQLELKLSGEGQLLMASTLEGSRR